MTRLSPVLSTHDLPMAELHALRLDGQLVALDETFTVIDQPLGRGQRAASLAHYCDERLIVEQHSAAWVWGALDTPPARHELCTSIGARSRSVHPRRLLVREVVIADDDWVSVGGVHVTTPLRTAGDLARFAEQFDLAMVARLLAVDNLTIDDCVRDLESRRNLPRKKAALTRLNPSTGRAPLVRPPAVNS